MNTRRRRRAGGVLASVVLAAGVAAGVGGGHAAPAPDFERAVVPLLKKYCYECHGDGVAKAGLAFDEFKTLTDVRGARKHFEAVLRAVTRHEMPPADAVEFPTAEERETIARFVEQELFQIDPANPDPGRVTLRRLNRAEYENVIRDLVGVESKPAADFPPDDSGYGFDNIADVLSLSPMLMEKYLAAAEQVLDQAIVTETIQSRVQRVPASLAKIGFNAVGDRGDGWVHLISLEEDDAAVELPFPATGDYLVRFHAYATKTGGALVGQGSEKPIEFKDDPGPTRIALAVNDAFATDFEIATDAQAPQTYEARVSIPDGKQNVRVVMRRKRGGESELTMLNGRLGKQQPGIVFVRWIEIEGPLPAATRRFPTDALVHEGEGARLSEDAWVLEKNGQVATEFQLEREAEVILRAQAYAYQAGGDATRMEFRVDGAAVKAFAVKAPGQMQPLPRQRVFSPQLLVPQPEVHEARVKLPAGRHRFAAAFTNDFVDPENSNPNLRDRRLVIQHLEVSDLSSPVLTPPLPAPLAELFARFGAAEDEPAARRIIGAFARRAWRRPVESGEVDKLLRFYRAVRDDGESFAAGVKLALKATLVSPHFLFIGEVGEKTEGQVAAAAGKLAAPINEIALASRLSFFLWSAGPDEELLGLAERGELRANLEAQVRRMLHSPKARALVDNFATQWLELRNLENVQPDRRQFSDFDAALRGAMRRETELFFAHVMREDRSVLDFLGGDYTFVNGRLAKFYGIAGVDGEEFRRVSLVNSPRRGVLTHASVLTLTSNPTRTSPVKRGKWVLENLLGSPPPPPPPDVPELEADGRKLTGTLREQMQQHSANPTCASCHQRMDPIGFGLENFNAIGGWRAKDGGADIDASGKLGGGDAFQGAAELSALLVRQRAEDFRRCIAEKMLTYALGRGVEFYDRPAVDEIRRRLREGGDTFSTLILAVAQSFPFQHRRAVAASHVTSNP